MAFVQFLPVEACSLGTASAQWSWLRTSGPFWSSGVIASHCLQPGCKETLAPPLKGKPLFQGAPQVTGCNLAEQTQQHVEAGRNLLRLPPISSYPLRDFSILVFKRRKAPRLKFSGRFSHRCWSRPFWQKWLKPFGLQVCDPYCNDILNKKGLHARRREKAQLDCGTWSKGTEDEPQLTRI